MTESAVETSIEETGLPKSWENATLSDIGQVASGSTPKTKDPSNFDGDIPWITPADLSGYTHKTISNGRRNISQRGLETSSARLLPTGTVLFSSRAPIGYVVIARIPVATNQGFKSLIISEHVYNEYVYYYLKASKVLAESYSSGTTFKELSGKAFGNLPIPLSPLNEQRRIVGKIEELFTKLDAGVESLKKTQALLKQYRQSVLKAAVTGELSRKWREDHADELEPASELLERILQERREKWTGKRYKEPVCLTSTKPPEVPETWLWTSFESLSIASQNGLAKRRGNDGMLTPVLRLADIENNGISSAQARSIKLSTQEVAKYVLNLNDFIFTRVNGSRDLVGSAILFNERKTWAFCDHFIRVTTVTENIKPGYLAHYFKSEIARHHISQHMVTTAGQNTISQPSLLSTPVAVPSLLEQEVILQELGHRLSIIESLEATVEENLKRSKRLRQSILKQAFSGQLVPQDPKNEPASILLERIREERLTTKQKPRKQRREEKQAESLALFTDERD